MAYKIQFWTFAKKSNSTALPGGTALSEFNCTIVEPSGVLAPVIELKLNNATNPTAYNYAYIPMWARYYYVRDWYYLDGIWKAQFQIDTLASWKNYIGATSAYIARSSAAMNGRIADTTYPIIAGNTVSITQANNPFATALQNGYFVVGIINNDTGAIGAVSYYIMTNTQFRAFCAFLLGDSTWMGNVTDVTISMAKLLANPFQYVVSCTWLPFTPILGDLVNSVPFGWWTAPVSAYRYPTQSRKEGFTTIAVPKHPLALTRGYYLLNEPYSEYYLDWQPVGSISIPADKLVDTDVLTLHWDCDPITGKGKIIIIGSSAFPISIFTAQIGVPVQLASTAPDMVGALTQILNPSGSPVYGLGLQEAVTNQKPGIISDIKNVTSDLMGIDWNNSPVNKAAATIDTAVEGMKKFATNIGSAYLSKMYPAQSIGNNGGFSAGLYNIRLCAAFARIADDDNADRGRPLCETRVINTIPGYIQLAEAHFQIPCTLSELEEINTAAVSGFFYE